MSSACDPRFPVALRVARLAAVAEIAAIVGWTFRAAPPDAPLYAGALWAMIKTAPLLVLLPGLFRGSPRTAIWLCYVLCGYFLAAVIDVASPPPLRWIGCLEVVATVTGFCAGLLAGRWGRGAPEPPLSPS